MNIFHSVAELAGNTPLLELCRYERRHGLNARILAKLECCNVAGSAKRLHDGWLAFYVVFLPCVMLHTGVGVYRLAVKYGVCTKAERARWRRWIWIVMGCYLVLGVLAMTRVWFLG